MLTEKEIKDIIHNEITVDTHTDEEAETGWAIFMGDNIRYPFEAIHMAKDKSGKVTPQKVQAVGPHSNESNFSMDAFYVEIEVNGLIVPASIEKLDITQADDETLKALQIWKCRFKY